MEAGRQAEVLSDVIFLEKAQVWGLLTSTPHDFGFERVEDLPREKTLAYTDVPEGITLSEMSHRHWGQKDCVISLTR